MGNHLIVLGHGDGDSGATGSGTSEAQFLREEMLPVLKKYAPDNVSFYTKNMYKRRDADTIPTYDSVTELHLDSAKGGSGGHVIIYDEYEPDNVDLALRKVIHNVVGLRGSDGIDKRDDLYNLNVFADRGITYRLVELGFINNPHDMKKIRDNLHEYSIRILEAITGDQIMRVSSNKNKEEIPEWAKKAVEYMTENGLGDGKRLDETMTRMEGYVLDYRLIQHIKELMKGE